MICNFESMGAQPVGYGFVSRKRKVTANVKVMRLDRGGEPFVLIVDGQFNLLCVCARSGGGHLRKLLDVLDFKDRASPCATLADCLGTGCVVAGHRAAEWMSREARLLIELRGHVQKVLGGEVSDD